MVPATLQNFPNGLQPARFGQLFFGGVRKIGPIAVCLHNIGANVRFPASETSERVYRKVGFFAPPPLPI